VFVRSGAAWVEQRKLIGSDAAALDGFGASLALSGDTMVVGAPGQGGPPGAARGSVYVFARSGSVWTEQQKLVPSDGALSRAFGAAVAISGTTIVVGAPGAGTPGGEFAGAVYVFVRSGTTWNEQQRLIASDGDNSDFLGRSVAVSGDTVVAGAPFDAVDGLAGAGSAYVFVRTGMAWTQQQKLTAADTALAADWFGNAVSVSGDTVVVGAPNRLPVAYVFVRTGTVWTRQQRLAPSDRGLGFGSAVAVAGNTAVIGAPEDDATGLPYRGAAYVFARSGTAWSQREKVLAPDGLMGDAFGAALSLAGDTLAVGAPRDDAPAGEAAGSARVFRLQGRSPARYYPVTPCRVIDTRIAGSPLAANSTRTFSLGGACQVPPDARSVVVILTAVNPGAPGNLRVYATEASVPLASTLNFATGRTRANNAAVSLGTGGQINVQCDMPPGSTAGTHFVLDVLGYFN
jgi:hypothetical protein